MRSISKAQLALLITGAAVFIGLLFANTRMPAKPAASETEVSTAKITLTIDESLAALTSSESSVVKKLEEEAESSNPSKQVELYDSLAKISYSYKKPELAAWFYEKSALKNNSAPNWYNAGNAYYVAARFVKEEIRPQFYTKAIDCLESSLKADSNNLKTKTALGVAYVEGTPNPMKGITMLKEVVATDSNNIDAHLNLALFSEKSGQFDKAISRFQKVLNIDPTFLEAYLHIADAFEQMGNRPEAIKNLEKYVSKVDDITIKTEVQNYINKLKIS
jgi:tetratricopeptide (TPR) repeat protein